MGKLTGGNWEARANEYWVAWHRSARNSFETYMERDRAVMALREISELDPADFDGDAEDALGQAQDIAHRALTARDVPTDSEEGA